MNRNRSLSFYYAYSFLHGLRFTWTTWLAFVLLRGGNPGWAEACFHASIWLGEVPTGMVADMFGRKRSMMIGLALGAVASTSFLLVRDTFSACLVMMLAGLSGTFQSGADKALLYETAVRDGGEEGARKALARANIIFLLALTAAPFAAGLLFQIDSRLPFLAQAAADVAALAASWLIKEEPRATSGRANLSEQLRIGAGLIRSNKSVFLLVLFGWFYWTGSSMTGQYAQAYFPATGLTMAAAGAVFSIARVLETAGSACAVGMSPRTALASLRFLPLVAFAGYFAMGLRGAYYGAALFIAISFIDGLLEPTFQLRLNAEIPDAQRATVLSLVNAGSSVMMSFAFPAASYLTPVSRVYTVVGGAGLLLAAIWARTLRPSSRSRSEDGTR
jgi:MFS family permease